jgi:hypothetical protein
VFSPKLGEARFDMRKDTQVDERNSLDDLVNGKATLMTSRRSLLAGSKLFAAAGLTFGLGLVGRSSSASAQIASTALAPSVRAKCFLAGTRIETTKGEVSVERLRIGDRVLTVLGEAKPIKFIGRREVSREPCQTWSSQGPVKISRFAIDGKAPHSDLYVSPAHAIYINGVLIPVSVLVNSITIVANAKPEALSLTYYHIELDTHEAILAEGLPVESFLRNGMEAFDNADDYISLYSSPPGPLTPFAPIVSYNGGRQELASHIRSALAPVCDFRRPIDKVRDRIADRAEFACAA